MELVRVLKQWVKFLKGNGYRYIKCVGNGSFGDVYAVSKLDTRETFAVKRLVARRKIKEDKYAMAEINALIELDHPNIVGLEEVLLSERVACIVMELAPEGNLEMLVLDKSVLLEVEIVTLYFTQIISAVEFCHRHYIAHRDLNPSNILVFSKTLVKLADFGLCFRCRNDNDSSSDELRCEDFLGQDSYLAPEVKSHQSFLACAADVWSLGCVLYFMINCSHPPLKDGGKNDFVETASKLDDPNLKNMYNEIFEKITNTFTLTFQNAPCSRASVSEIAHLWDT